MLGIPSHLADWVSQDRCPRVGNCKLVPLSKVLPMGWNWSVHLAQRAHETVGVGLGFDPANRIVDRYPAHPCAAGGIRSAVYIDNFLITGQDKSEVIALHRKRKSGLEALGLPAHECEADLAEIDYVGLHFDGAAHEVRLSWVRLWRLRLALLHISATI